MKVIQVNSDDQGGGAAKIAYQLFNFCLQEKLGTKFLVGRKHLDDENIYLIRNDYGSIWQRLLGKVDKFIGTYFGKIKGSFILRDYLHLIANPKANIARSRNRIDRYYTGTKNIIDQVGFKPDILHLHNLHGKYFDLSALPLLSSQAQVIWTLHDQWAFTGTCAYTLGCERWKIGCGDCPQIGKYYTKPDATHYNWSQKRKIYSNCSLIVCAPSKWLYEKAKKSILGTSRIHYIPNGVNTSIFKPNKRDDIRKKHNIKRDDIVLLFTANKGVKSPWKDYDTVVSSAHKIADKLPRKKVFLLNLGHVKKIEVRDNLKILSLPYVSTEEEISEYYQMSDLYIHAANAENLPLAILEAMACGLPTVASNVGGIPEIIEDGKSGFLVPAGDPTVMAEYVLNILKDDELYSHMSKRSREIITEKYSLEKMLGRYMDLYKSIQEDREIV